MNNKILYTAKFTHHDLKFHKVWWKSDKRCRSWSRQTDRQTDRQADSYISPQTMFAGGIIIDESLILAIVLRNYSTKPSYIFQFKRELKVWKCISNIFHFEMLIQNSNPKFQPLCLFVLTFHEYEARFGFGFRLDYQLSLFIFLLLLCQVVLCIIYVL
jgi:hypothetical protein